ncbi:MAG: hypothetical protein ACI91J_000204 [Yoonia sp.]
MEQPESRQVVVVGMNILYGAAVTLRVNVLRSQGVRLSAELSRPVPFELAELNQLFCQ